MYEAFYGFREKPFTLTPDPRYFYPSQAHREALDHLLYGIREREGFIVVTGDVGTGKTTLCRAILSQLSETTRTAVILNPILSEEELLRAVLQDFGLSGAGRTKNELIAELNAFLVDSLTADRRVVLIIDEAQNLSHALLEQIRLLSNLETERDKLIQIVLVGQLELLEHLASPELKQLNQRISVRYCLPPLSYAETCQYVYHRLMVAGGTVGVSFDGRALRVIYKYSRGIPRLINLAADRALLQAFADQKRQITRRIALAGIASLGGHDQQPRAARVWPKRVLAVAVIAVAVAVGAAGWWVWNLLGTGRMSSPDIPLVISHADILRAYRVPSTEAIRNPGWVGDHSADGPAGSSASPTAAADGSRFSVLVATSTTEPEARALERRLSEEGFAARVARQTLQGGGVTFGVLVGPMRDRLEAQRARDGFAERLGFAGARVVPTSGSDGATP